MRAIGVNLSLRNFRTGIRFKPKSAIARATCDYPVRHSHEPLGVNGDHPGLTLANLRWMATPLRLTVANLRLMRANRGLTVANLRLMRANLRLMRAHLRLTVANLRLTRANLRCRVANMRWIVAHLRLTIVETKRMHSCPHTDFSDRHIY
jgi:hypothetical protein